MCRSRGVLSLIEASADRFAIFYPLFSLPNPIFQQYCLKIGFPWSKTADSCSNRQQIVGLGPRCLSDCKFMPAQCLFSRNFKKKACFWSKYFQKKGLFLFKIGRNLGVIWGFFTLGYAKIHL
jgi:hypothetical protein